MAIYFFCEGVNFIFKNKSKYKNWIKDVVNCEDRVIGNINYIFTNDEFILSINREYLNHDYFTDIITFNYNNNKRLSGDLYISLETIKSNAIKYNISFMDELNRVIIHGILHLVGYNDDTMENQLIIREREDFYLKKFVIIS